MSPSYLCAHLTISWCTLVSLASQSKRGLFWSLLPGFRDRSGSVAQTENVISLEYIECKVVKCVNNYLARALESATVKLIHHYLTVQYMIFSTLPLTNYIWLQDLIYGS